MDFSPGVRIEPLEGRRLYSVTVAVAPFAPAGYAPAQVRHAYGFDAVSFKSGSKTIPGDGRGQTIAVVTAYHAPTVAADLKVFNKQFGLPNTTGGKPVLSIAKPQGMPLVNPVWAQEAALDVEWAHAVAPRAKILLVEAKSDATADLFGAVDYARRRKGVVAVSISWGWDTPPGDVPSYSGVFATPPNHVGGYKRGDGVTFVVAAGDTGAPAAWPDPSVPVVTVGATALQLDLAGDYYGETLLPQSVTAATVAYNGSDDPGYAVYDSTSYQGQAGWQLGTGTSAGAPQWAGLVAVAAQGRALSKKHALDGATQTLPALAALPADDFHVITNATSASGRGSPFADKVIRDLVDF